MLKKNRLFTPGPTPLLPQAQLAMAAYGAHHRTAEFRALFTRVLADVKEFIGTKNDVLVLTSSGTGFMEASVSNLTSPGDRVLVLTAGKFGERWVSLAKAFGCEVETVTAPYGETFSLDELRRKLTPEIRCVYVQATESSTGVRHDVEAIAKLVRASDALPDTLLIVDAITGLGTTHLDVDGWGIDIILGGSQKALMIPPGLAYGAVSERAWQRMERTTSPRYYFDLRKERKAAAKAETASTPATALFAGLAAALDYVRQMGRRKSSDGPRRADCERGTVRGDDPRRRRSAGTETIRDEFSRGRADGGRRPCGHRFHRYLPTFPRAVRRGRGQRQCGNERTTFPHRPHRLLRLSRYRRSARRARASHDSAVQQESGIRQRRPRRPASLRASVRRTLGFSGLSLRLPLEIKRDGQRQNHSRHAQQSQGRHGAGSAIMTFRAIAMSATSRTTRT
jgi:aspartate aminotransferase-like enzyme